MSRYAMVDQGSGIVVNVIEWDGNEETWQPPPGYQMVEDPDFRAGPGYSWDGETFQPPPGGEPGETS